MALAKPTTRHVAGAALPAEGRAVPHAAEGIQRWPELTATCFRALLLSPSCPSLELWFPADHATLRDYPLAVVLRGRKYRSSYIPVPCRLHVGGDPLPPVPLPSTQSHPFHTVLCSGLCRSRLAEAPPFRGKAVRAASPPPCSCTGAETPMWELHL